jgi:hypothetical protein
LKYSSDQEQTGGNLTAALALVSVILVLLWTIFG